MSIAIDTHGDFGDYLNDPKRRISEQKLNEVCHIHAKDKTCRYISLTAEGFVCVKNSPMQSSIDTMVREKKFRATGDNCGGLGISD